MASSFSTLSAADTPAKAEWVAFINCRTEPKNPKDSSSTISPLEKGMAPAASCPAAMQVETATAP